ncbi:hypothetical protein B0H19DRAFT_1140953 [Mycena capillaripes]|nr:hypothetical protein B0H19DRAFT_1140953 [Mycena capillaripes]
MNTSLTQQESMRGATHGFPRGPSQGSLLERPRGKTGRWGYSGGISRTSPDPSQWRSAESRSLRPRSGWLDRRA